MLPPLREVIAAHGLSASKALGQNFLLDEQLLDRIARIPGDLQGRAVLEADLARVRQQQQDPERTRRALERGAHSLVSAPLQARGVPLGVVNFVRVGDSPPFDEEDASFAEELAARAAVSIDNARRFSREHAMAVTLQRSLLPRELPEQDALEVAWRYLPAEAGVGGDWFDFIPLPGARVALVVGDVVGHGLHAAATMGRLRTAVHNFSALDLPVDEVLGYLDDLVIRMDSEKNTGEGTEGGRAEEVTGATCLYAIYDSVTGTCTMARAGHPGPAVPGDRRGDPRAVREVRAGLQHRPVLAADRLDVVQDLPAGDAAAQGRSARARRGYRGQHAGHTGRGRRSLRSRSGRKTGDREGHGPGRHRVRRHPRGADRDDPGRCRPRGHPRGGGVGHGRARDA